MAAEKGKPQAEGIFLEPADTYDDAWHAAQKYALLLDKAGMAGKWTVGVGRNAPDSRSAVNGGSYRVELYDERGPDDQSLPLSGVVRLLQRGHAR